MKRVGGSEIFPRPALIERTEDMKLTTTQQRAVGEAMRKLGYGWPGGDMIQRIANAVLDAVRPAEGQVPDEPPVLEHGLWPVSANRERKLISDMLIRPTTTVFVVRNRKDAPPEVRYEKSKRSVALLLADAAESGAQVYVAWPGIYTQDIFYVRPEDYPEMMKALGFVARTVTPEVTVKVGDTTYVRRET